MEENSMSTYTPIIGIEIHVELATKSKMFCGCVNDPFGAEKPNIYTCPVCLGLPGALPVANKTAVEWTIKIGQALGCKIPLFSKFDRKHYFYPDLPKGYQISQYDQPLCLTGTVNTPQGAVGITRVHLEEDTGKLLHKTIDGKQLSLVDFNRSSVPLVEIVTEPDIRSGAQAKEYTKKIHQIIRYLGVSSADMEKGSMRLEANISVQSEEEKAAGKLPDYKVEVKNLNSFRFIERAIEYEIARQTVVRQKGELPAQETRGWNDVKGETTIQRTKESADDYRYFPDPDLPPMRFSQEQIDAIKQTLPILPDAVVEQLTAAGIKPSEAAIIADDPKLGRIVQTLCASLPDQAPKIVTQLVNKKISLRGYATIEQAVTDLVDQSKKLVATVAIDPEKLREAIVQVIAEQPKAVADYRSGKTQVLGFLFGMLTKKVGKIAPDDARPLFEEYLKG